MTIRLRPLAYSIIAITFIAFLNSCGVQNKVQLSHHVSSVPCHPANRFITNQQPIKTIDTLTLDTILTNHYSSPSLNIANAFGFLDILKQYEEISDKYIQMPTTELRMQKIEKAMKLSESIDLASLEISSFASELDCEEERITQIADFLKGKEKQRETRLTVAAIVVGAVGGVASGILATNEKTGEAGNYLGIATGVAETVLGVLIMKNSKKIELAHPRNMLRDIWYAPPTSEIFPASIWYYLTYKSANAPQSLSLREKIMDRWKNFSQINEDEIDQFESLYLKDKGVYDTESLYNRAKMYDQIESFVKMMKQDLTTLSLELAKQSKN